MADIVFYGNITVSVLGFEGVNLVTKGYSDENLCSISNVASQWSGTITSKATTTSFGLVKIGSGFSASNGTISVGSATSSGIGGVIVGNGLSVSSGTVSYSVCRKRVYTLSNGSLTIDGTYGAYYYSLGSNTTFTFNSSALSNSIYAGNVCEFDLAVAVGSTAYTATFPNNITWDHAPSAFNTNTTYLFRFRTYDRGSHWFGYCLNSIPTITGVSIWLYDGEVGVGDSYSGVSGTISGDVVTYNVDGVDYIASAPYYSGPELTAGTHNITVTVSRSGYQNYSQSGTVTVSKVNANYFDVTVNDIDVGDVLVITASTVRDYTGNISFVIDNGEPTVIASSGGVAQLTLLSAPEGLHTVTATLLGDDKYNSGNTDTTQFNVYRVSGSLLLAADNIYQGQDAVITATGPDDGNGTVTFVVDGSGVNFDLNDGLFDSGIDASINSGPYTVNMVNGTAVLTLSNLPPDEYVVSATVTFTTKYTQASNTTTFQVSALQTITGVSATGGSVSYDGDPHAVSGLVTVTGIQSGDTVTFSPTTVTTAGTHTITITVSRSGYADYVTTCDVTVSASATPLVLTLNTPSDIHYGVTATIGGSVSPTGLTNGVATVVVDGVDTYTTAIESDGVFSESISGLTVGTHTIEVIVSADGCSDDSDEITITVTKITTATTASNPTVQYNYPHDVAVKATVRPSYGSGSDVTGSVRFVSSPAGMFQTVTASVINGKANGIVYIEEAGKYRYIAYYDGDDTHETSSGTGEITARKPKTPIT